MNQNCMNGTSSMATSKEMPKISVMDQGKLVSSDDELAVVLGHEVAHAVAKHSTHWVSCVTPLIRHFQSFLQSITVIIRMAQRLQFWISRPMKAAWIVSMVSLRVLAIRKINLRL